MSPRVTLSTEPEATVEPELQLDPRVRQQFLTLFRQYQELHAQQTAIQTELDVVKARLGALRDETGELSVGIDGCRTTLVGGTTKTLNKKRLIALGCKKEWLNEATEERPRKAYERVTLPGQTDWRGAEED